MLLRIHAALLTLSLLIMRCTQLVNFSTIQGLSEQNDNLILRIFSLIIMYRMSVTLQTHAAVDDIAFVQEHEMWLRA